MRISAHIIKIWSEKMTTDYPTCSKVIKVLYLNNDHVLQDATDIVFRE